MSPEHVADTKIDRRTDVYGAGIVLWEMLTGQYFWGDRNELQILNALLNGFEITPPRSINPNIPARLSNACMKALAFQPAERWATCEEFRLELQAILAEMKAISTHDIGRLVSEMFCDLREKHRQNIVGRLAGVQLPEAALRHLREQFSIPIPSVESTTGARAWETSATNSRSPASTAEYTSTLVSGAGNQRGLIIGSLAVCGTLLGLAVAWRMNYQQGLATTPSPIGSDLAQQTALNVPKAAPVEAAKPGEIAVTLRVIPADAVASWDGVLMTSNPSVRRFKRDGSMYEARVDAPGYESKSVTLFLTSDQSFMITLDKDKRRRGRFVAPQRPASAPAAAKPEAPAKEAEPSAKPGINLDNDDPWK
jgi:serine/threonine-protein kinase